MNPEFQLFPYAASDHAPGADLLFLFELGVSFIVSLLVAALIVYFAIRYRKGRRANRANPPETSYTLEAIWIGAPLAFMLVSFAWGTQLFFNYQRPPADAMQIRVIGKQWMWKLQHPDGQSEINTLHVPSGRPVRLIMTSEDVIHSFFIPAFRIKMDVLPGRYTTMWFRPTRVGEYHLFCAEYCGAEHSRMVGRVIVMEPSDYAAWLGGATGEPPQVAGEKLFQRFRCDSCHFQDQERCPPLGGLFGKETPLANGSLVLADEAYIRESIVDPGAKIVSGYQPVMPSYRGQITEEQILQIISYIKSLENPEAAPAQP